MTASELAQAILLAQGHWPNFRVSRATPVSWERLLGDLEFELVVTALDRLALESPEWPPGAGAVRAMARGSVVGDQAPDVDEAWAEVSRAIRRVGSYGNPEFTHVAISAAVDALGWKTLCMSENPVADRAHFLRIYDVTVRRAERERTMTPAMAALAPSLKAIGRTVPDD